jgi:hypothetical protein
MGALSLPAGGSIPSDTGLDPGQRTFDPLASALGLIDEFLLMIHPLVLGSGQRLLEHDGHVARLTRC